MQLRGEAPQELSPYLVDDNLYSFPVCGDIVRRLMAFHEDLEIDDRLMDLLRSVAAEQRKALATAELLDTSGDPRLFPYQRVAVEWLGHVRKGILGDEPGSGKTVMSLVRGSGAQPKRSVVVCSSSKGPDWVRHARSWTDQPASLLEGTAAERSTILSQWSSGYLVCNYKTLTIHSKQLAKADLVIVDEAHKVRNRKTGAFTALKPICRRAKDVHLLTADPTINKAEDIWTLLHLCDPIRFSSYWGFVFRFFNVENDGFGLSINGIREEEQENFRRILSPYLLCREGLVNVPEPRKVKLNYELEGLHRELYDEMDTEGVVVYQGKRVFVATEVAKMTRLRQLAISPALLWPGYKGPSKLDVLPSLVRKMPGKVVIFAQFAEVTDLIGQYLNGQGIETVVIHGTAKGDRDELITRFRKGTPKCAAVTHGTGGEGLDLFEANREIFVELAWHPSGNRQAVARIARNGQQSNDLEVVIVHSVGTVEDDIESINIDKVPVTIGEILKRRKRK